MSVGLTFADIVREVGEQHGHPNLTTEEVTFILWEHTGYPSFWMKDAEAECRRQVEKFFRTSSSELDEVAAS